MANILIVDDDWDVGDACQSILEDEGHVVRTAPNGLEGLQRLRAAPLPNLVILDVEMPVLGGPGMAHQMLVHDAGEEKIPVILISARDDLSEIAGRLGTPYFLHKPFDIDALHQVVARALREHAPPSSA